MISQMIKDAWKEDKARTIFLSMGILVAIGMIILSMTCLGLSVFLG